MEYSVDVIIPSYKPNASFEKLIYRLQKQTIKPDRIIVVNTGEEYWEQAEFDKSPFVFGNLAGMKMELYHIQECEFDHGGTRRWAAGKSHAEYMLFMTQDAMPADQFLIENLLKALNQDPMIGAAYARQLPAPGCRMIERLSREFNYGEKSMVKSGKDLEQMGIKTYFCSNVCAMYRRNIYLSVGGFVKSTIFNEDMICAGTMVQKGYRIAYAADAEVYHSHNYTGIQQLKRNFDLGVSHAQYPEIFGGVATQQEGMKLVKETAGYLLKTGKPFMIFKLFWQSGCKYLGYRLGKNYRKLPRRAVLFLTMNREYWKV